MHVDCMEANLVHHHLWDRYPHMPCSGHPPSTPLPPKPRRDYQGSCVLSAHLNGVWHVCLPCMQNGIGVDRNKVRNEACKSQCNAGESCYLHLHGASSWVRGSAERPSVYAAKSAPGLVMASGARREKPKSYDSPVMGSLLLPDVYQRLSRTAQRSRTILTVAESFWATSP